MRKVFLVFIFSVFVMSLSAVPARRQSRNVALTNVEKMIAAYRDSLEICKHDVDSVMATSVAVEDSDVRNDSRYFKLFMPLNFYHSVSQYKFLNNVEADTIVAGALLNIYLKRPDLVKTTDNKLLTMAQEHKENEDADVKPRYVDMKSQIDRVRQDNTEMEEIKQQPIDMFVAKPNFWKFSGEYYLQFLQNYVSPNWYKGGSNNYSMLGTVTLQYNYNNKQKVKWSNKLEMKLGFRNTEADTVNHFKAMEDLIRLTSSIGLQAHKNWYYTAQVIANTQFAQGRKDNKTEVYSDFMSPFNLNVSLGMDYSVKTKNNRLSGNVHLAPIAYNLKYVDRLALANSFGLEPDTHALHDYGSQMTVELDWLPFDLLKWHTRLYAYTTYEKFELEWENTFTFQFNKYISANLFLYPRFDDSAKRVDDYSYWQFKEYISIGFSYSM